MLDAELQAVEWHLLHSGYCCFHVNMVLICLLRQGLCKHVQSFAAGDQ